MNIHYSCMFISLYDFFIRSLFSKVLQIFLKYFMILSIKNVIYYKKYPSFVIGLILFVRCYLISILLKTYLIDHILYKIFKILLYFLLKVDNLEI